MSTGRGWARGEIAPALRKRVDLATYTSSLALANNFWVMKEGTVQNRPGTSFIAPAKYATTASKHVKLAPFVFNSEEGNTYVLEFGHQYIRFHKDGEQIRLTGQSITGISKANPGVVTYSGSDTYANGDEVYISGVLGMTEVNGRWFKVANVDTGANTFELNTRDSVNVNTSSYTTYTSGGTVEEVYEISTTYDNADVTGLSIAQRDDTIIICGGNSTKYYPRVLTRSSDTSWAIADLPIGSFRFRPCGLSGVAGAAGAKTFRYKVTAIFTDDFVNQYKSYGAFSGESLPGTESEKLVSAITKANPAVVSCTAHGFNSGDKVIIELEDGMTEIIRREFTITTGSNYTPASPVTISSVTKSTAATNVPPANYTATVINATSHGYSNGDVVNFSVAGMVELNSIENCVVANKTANTFEILYSGTSVNVDSSLFNSFTSGTVTKVVPATVNSFTIPDVDSTNYTTFTNTFATAAALRTHCQIDLAADPTSTAPNVISWDGITVGNYVNTQTSGVKEYVIYKEVNGVYGFIGTATGTSTSFRDIGITPDTGDSPREYAECWTESGDYPYCVTFGKQRLLFGGSDNHPNRIIGSATGDYYNFYGHAVTAASDTITIDLAGDQTQIVRSLREVAGRVVAFCDGGEFGLGDVDGILDATAPDAKQWSGNGSTTLPSLVVNNSATYIQARSNQVRDLGLRLVSDGSSGFDGDERSIYSNHLFKGHTITDWAYQRVPNSLIWMVRDDGVLLGFTYFKEQQQFAWHQHKMYNLQPIHGTTEYATVESVCVIPESEEDSLYIAVRRYQESSAGGMYIERLNTRQIINANIDPINTPVKATASLGGFNEGGVADLVMVDSAKTYDGRNTDATVVLHFANTGGPYDETTVLTVNSVYANNHANNFAYFDATMVGKTLFIYDSDGEVVKFLIETYTNSHAVSGHVDRDLTQALSPNYDSEYIVNWSLAISSLGELWHLAGTQVAVTGDGFVEANPMNDDYTVITVSSTTGKATFSRAYERVQVGVPYQATIQTLGIDAVNVPGGGLINKDIIVNKLYIEVFETRGLKVGTTEPDINGSVDLTDFSSIQRRSNDLTYDYPEDAETARWDQDLISDWSMKGGQVVISQIDPLPATILAIVPDGVTFI